MNVTPERLFENGDAFAWFDNNDGSRSRAPPCCVRVERVHVLVWQFFAKFPKHRGKARDDGSFRMVAQIIHFGSPFWRDCDSITVSVVHDDFPLRVFIGYAHVSFHVRAAHGAVDAPCL